jgi:hypothetical protein
MSTANLDSADLKAVDYNGLINEDVMQKIWDISRIPLPFTDMIGTDTCKNEYKEWTTDELAAPDVDNAVVDGSDAGTSDTKSGERVGNHCQISDKVVRVSTRANESDSVGDAGKLSYQVMMRQRELRRDVEAISLTQQASVADNGDDIAGRSAGLGAWLTTSDYRGATGAAAGFANGIVAAATAGNKQGLTESLVRDCVQSVYQEGGDPTVMMSVPSVIRAFSEYLFTSSARVATLMADQGKSAEKATALGSVNVFVTDFGTLDLVDNRLQQGYTAADTGTVYCAYIITPSMLAHGYLHGYRVEPLAKTGLADNRQMAVDWTLIVNNEKAHGVIADIDPTIAVVA